MPTCLPPVSKDAEIGAEYTITEPALNQPLPTPDQLKATHPLSVFAKKTVQNGRSDVRNILRGHDPRMMVVVGPCSVHDTSDALEYARRLRDLQEGVADTLLLVMRVYLEKPRTTVGWRGLLNDPYMDGSCDMAEGLRRSRLLLSQIAELGLPTATEMLDIAAPTYLSDLVSFVGIGARTTESQPHRALASGLPCPVGFKNGMDGTAQVALDALLSVRANHSYIGINELGMPSVVRTHGNPDAAVILRGGKTTGPNFGSEFVQAAEAAMERIGTQPAVIVDCSHGNSGYDPARQANVCENVACQKREGSRSLVGVMLESNLSGGKQSLPPVLSPGVVQNLQAGVSVTDACLGWDDTRDLLLSLSASLM